LPERDFYLSDVVNMNKNVKYLVVRWAGWHEDLLARQPNLVVPGKRTVLSVEPCCGRGFTPESQQNHKGPLHTGQVDFCVLHSCRQLSWNKWLHLGKAKTCFSLKLSIQIGHVSPESSGCCSLRAICGSWFSSNCDCARATVSSNSCNESCQARTCSWNSKNLSQSSGAVVEGVGAWDGGFWGMGRGSKGLSEP
jgi:hypothetical protein